MNTITKPHIYKSYGADEVECLICGHEPWMRAAPCATPCNHTWTPLSQYDGKLSACADCGDHR